MGLIDKISRKKGEFEETTSTKSVIILYAIVIATIFFILPLIIGMIGAGFIKIDFVNYPWESGIAVINTIIVLLTAIGGFL